MTVKGAYVLDGVVCATSSILFGTTSVAMGAELVNSWNELDEKKKFVGAIGTAAFAVGSAFMFREATKSFGKAYSKPIQELRILELELEGIAKTSNRRTKEQLAKAIAGNKEASALLKQIEEYTKNQEELLNKQKEIYERAVQNNPDPDAHETDEPDHHVIRPPKSKGFFGFKK